ncbi:MAG: sigma-70 family RNA polymerase sigma factor [Burkholderiales bacterium]|nr:sigma-70 family RNA polymerase sigma factor [Burkholderiales bacterium]MDE1926162.1 sigma-70 family RNA polymerase sigma factor [Burkholderiales bacterium]MDE2158049.1 sigma-70 family RNA polymerase sigma factor [Burkholderiales bacterium]MDE2501838.1 sigma-70 family RNA polymerase sigma factor [Burkholderiales bacterium]
MGDEAAYRQALGLVADRLRGYFASRLNGLSQDVEDLVQETLLALHLQRGTYDNGTPVTAWVHGIARHKLVDAWRRRGRQDRLFDSFDELPEALHPAAEEASGSRHDLVQLLAQLPGAQRRSIVATKLEGLSVVDAARREGVSESAVKINVHRGLKRLALLIRGGS